MRKLIEQLGELTEGLKIDRADKEVIKAFTEKKAADGKKLTTDGKRLDGQWMGGRGIAEWKDGKIHFNDLGSKAAQTVQGAVRKEAPKNWIAEEMLSEGVAFRLKSILGNIDKAEDLVEKLHGELRAAENGLDDAKGEFGGKQGEDLGELMDDVKDITRKLVYDKAGVLKGLENVGRGIRSFKA